MPNSAATLVLRLKPKRRWMQFGTRSMLALTTACGIWLGWRVNEVRHQREVLAVVESFGGTAYFDYQVTFDEHKPRLEIDPTREPPKGSWPRSVLGEEYFEAIIGAAFEVNVGLLINFGQTKVESQSFVF